VGTISSAQFVTFTNTGSSTINFGAETITGDFTWGGLGTCGSSLAVGGNCAMSIKFKPTTTGTRTGSLTVNDNASGSPQVVSLTGTGTTSAPAVSVTPSLLSFNNQNVGTTSAAQMVALNNSGTTNLSVSGISVSPSQFAVAAAPTLPLVLTPGQSANIGVTFTPSASGSVSGTLSIVSNAASSPTAVSLSGSGVKSSPSPVSITSSSLASGTQQQAYSATLTATGGTTPYSWTLFSGAFPTGLTLGAASGVISGTPSQSGTFSFTIQVKDSSGQTATTNLGIQIANAPLQIVTTSMPNATVGQAYGVQLNGTGGTTPYMWTVSAGTLPGGLSLSSSGLISGSATVAGSSSFTAQLTDAKGQTASQAYTVTITAATPTSCDVYASPTGADANSGTLAAPWQTLQHAFGALQPGQTLCLRAGTYPIVTGGTYSQTLSVSGTALAPITITNYPGEVAIVHGSTRVNGAYATFQSTPATAPGLIFEGPNGPGTNLDLIDVMNTHDVKFDHIEIRNGTYHAGLYQYNGYNIKVLGAYIHDNGRAGVNLDHGIYWDATSGGGNLIANCVIEHNASQGIALYSSSNPAQPSQVVVEENTFINNGHYGVDVWGTGNTVVNNILAGNGTVFNSRQMSVETGTNHIIDYNILWSTSTSFQGISNVTGQVVTHTLISDPLFVGSANHNYHLSIGSPAIGAGNLGYGQPVDKDNVSRAPGPDLGAYEYVP
jgi:hypothetical protein